MFVFVPPLGIASYNVSPLSTAVVRVAIAPCVLAISNCCSDSFIGCAAASVGLSRTGPKDSAKLLTHKGVICGSCSGWHEVQTLSFSFVIIVPLADNDESILSLIRTLCLVRLLLTARNIDLVHIAKNVSKRA